MKDNFFKIALENGDINRFFRGEGEYFVPSPDYEGHVHGAHMGGCVRTYADLCQENANNFDRAFRDFLGGLAVSKTDLGHMLANISSFSAQTSRGGFSKSHLFTKADSQEGRMLREYIELIAKSEFYDEVKDQITRHANFIEKKGLIRLSETLKK